VQDVSLPNFLQTINIGISSAHWAASTETLTGCFFAAAWMHGEFGSLPGDAHVT